MNAMPLYDRNWSEFGVHENYVMVRSRRGKVVSESSSEKRPLMRGWCHFFQTIVLSLFLIAEYENLDLASVVFILGKLCCVGASAHLHMIGFRTEKDYQIANAIDWASKWYLFLLLQLYPITTHTHTQ
mgnify:CR=1 FL=1